MEGDKLMGKMHFPKQNVDAVIERRLEGDVMVVVSTLIHMGTLLL